MKQRKLRWMMLVLAMGAIMMLGACKKKVAPPPPPPPPPPAAPTASLTANPNTVDKGQSTMLTWQTSNATDASIDGIGAVQTSGSQSVTPSDSTTYTLTAKGPGGTQTATARVTVNAPPAPPPQPSATEEELFSQTVKDIYFDYDKSDINPDQQSSLQGDIEFLRQHPNIAFTIEGTATSGARRNTTWLWATAAPIQCGTLWCRAASLPTTSKPSATARKSRSARSRPSSAGSRTAGVISCTRSRWCWRLDGCGMSKPTRANRPRHSR